MKSYVYSALCFGLKQVKTNKIIDHLILKVKIKTTEFLLKGNLYPSAVFKYFGIYQMKRPSAKLNQNFFGSAHLFWF